MLAHGEGRWEEAQAHYEQAVNLAGHHRQYLTNLAGLLLDQAKYQAALDRYEALLSVAPRLLLARLDAGNAARLAGQPDKAAWHHERLLRDIGVSDALTHGDNAAQWVFTVPQGELTMDAADTKRHYARLTVALTRWLNGDEPGTRQLVGEMTDTGGNPNACGPRSSRI